MMQQTKPGSSQKRNITISDLEEKNTDCKPKKTCHDQCKLKKDCVQRSSNLNQCLSNRCLPHTNPSLQDLPDIILVKIFSCLTLHQLLNRASLVCRKWHSLCMDSDLWRDVNVQGQMKVDDDILTRITSYSKNVSKLNITDSILITNQGADSVLKRCPNLQSLKLVRYNLFA